MIDLINKKFGLLTVIEYVDKAKSRGKTIWKCKCECGNFTDVRKDNLITKADTVSCGCRLKQLHQERREMGINEVSAIWSRAKYRAKRKGWEFTLQQEDIIIPETCPLLGIPLVSTNDKRDPRNPSLDQKIPGQGYTPDNIWVMSSRANWIKCDASIQELELLVENLKKL